MREDDDSWASKEGEEHAELWTANVQVHLREFRHRVGISEWFKEGGAD